MGYSCCDFTDDVFAELHRVGAITEAEFNDENLSGNASLRADYAFKGIARLVEVRDAAAKAKQFMQELPDLAETLTGIAEQHGPRTLAESKVQPALHERRIVVFAGGGVVLSVATEGLAEPPICVVVDYDDCRDRTEEGIRAFEQERIGQDRDGFDASGAKYIY